MKLPLLLTIAALALGACERSPSTPPEPAQSAAPSPPQPPASPVGLAFPAAFQGRWSASAEGCADEGADDSRLVITGDELMFHESIGKARTITTSGANEVTVVADFEGEGEAWSNMLRLTLSPDGQTLTIPQPDGPAMSRTRCAAPKGKT